METPKSKIENGKSLNKSSSSQLKPEQKEKDSLKKSSVDLDLDHQDSGHQDLAGQNSTIQDLKFNNLDRAGESGLSFGMIPFPGLKYAQALESTSSVDLKSEYNHFINGRWQPSLSGKIYPVMNPSTGKTLAKVSEASVEDVKKAVKCARGAYENIWSKMSGKERGRYLFRIGRRIQEKAKMLALVETMNNGKPIRESKNIDIPLAAAHFFYYGGWADKLEFVTPGSSSTPLGVVGQIIPWNFPLMMAAWKIAPALAAGNCVVLKPSETTPLTALLLCEIFEEVGLPPGVVNVVAGFEDAGRSLVENKGVNKIAFTGSTEVGLWIVEATAPEPSKTLTLELGGKSANIVFSDAAIEQAVEGVIQSIFFNQGHVCCAGSRLLLEESIEDTFLNKLENRMKTLRVGNPLDKNTDIGAIHSEKEFRKIRKFIDTAKAENLDYFEGGHYDDSSETSDKTSGKISEKGFFQKPIVCDLVQYL